MNNIDIKLLDEMSEDELNNLCKELYSRLDDISAEKQRRKKLKENYKLFPFTFEYTTIMLLLYMIYRTESKLLMLFHKTSSMTS